MSDETAKTVAIQLAGLARLHETPLTREGVRAARESLGVVVEALSPDSGTNAEVRTYLTGLVAGVALKLCELVVSGLYPAAVEGKKAAGVLAARRRIAEMFPEGTFQGDLARKGLLEPDDVPVLLALERIYANEGEPR